MTMTWTVRVTVLLGGCISALLLPLLTSAQSNAGFVQGLWYDSESIFVDEPVRIYAAIRNNTGGDLSGTVEFYINGNRIERRSVAALNNRIIESWTDWTPRYGTSTIKATLSRTEISSTASGTRSVSVVSALTEDIIFVDYDTDHDGIGNQSDQDDDNDGISDEAERRNGTNPLVFDDPGSTNETTDTTSSDASQNTSSSETTDDPEGLEQYITNETVVAPLSQITDIINRTRQSLDTYRDDRASKRADEAATPRIVSGNNSHLLETDQPFSTTSIPLLETTEISSFGTQTRTLAAEPPKGFWQQTWSVITSLFDGLYTFVLSLTSLFLWHPALVQLVLLLLSLLLVYKVAKRLGGRKGGD